MKWPRAAEALSCLKAGQWELLYPFSTEDTLWRARVAWPRWSKEYPVHQKLCREGAEGEHLQSLCCEFSVVWTQRRKNKSQILVEAWCFLWVSRGRDGSFAPGRVVQKCRSLSNANLREELCQVLDTWAGSLVFLSHNQLSREAERQRLLYGRYRIQRPRASLGSEASHLVFHKLPLGFFSYL